jgi:hypothetical protein
MRAHMNRLTWLLGTAVLALGLGVAVAKAQPAGPKNLQVLPKSTTKDQVKTIMKAQAKALGVECDFCHEVPDMAADTNEHKKIARQMMKMTEEINAKWIKGWPGAEKHPVSCNTCHQGKAEPSP